MKTHKKALLSMRRFWQLLLHYDVKSATIMQSFKKIQSTQYVVSNMFAVLGVQPHAGSASSSTLTFSEGIQEQLWSSTLARLCQAALLVIRPYPSSHAAG